MTRRVLLTLASALLAIGDVELTVRLLVPQPLSGTWLTPSGRGYNVNKRSLIARHVQDWRDVTYRLNSLGLRGDEPSDRGGRVLVVGDSFTFGWLLQEGDTYVSQLAARARGRFGDRITIMNGGVAGWGTADYVAFAEDTRAELRPSAVVVFIGADDVSRAWQSGLWSDTGNGLARAPYRDPSLDIRKVSRVSGYNALIEHSHAAQLLRRVLGGLIDESASTTPMPPDARTAASRARLLFEHLAHWCKANGISLMVVAGPWAAIGARAADDQTQMFLTDAAEWFERQQIPFFTTGPVEGFATAFAIADGSHPNERGATKTAELVWPWLSEQFRSLLERK